MACCRILNAEADTEIQLSSLKFNIEVYQMLIIVILSELINISLFLIANRANMNEYNLQKWKLAGDRSHF